MTPNRAKDSLHLDPEDFPRSIDLELKEEVAKKINEIAMKTGRSFSEVAADILSKAVDPI
jgi:predicted transcriptional regulator